MLFTKKRIALFAIAASSIVTMPAFAQSAKSNAVISIQRNERDNTPSAITFSTQAGYKAGDAAAVLSQYLELNPATDELRYLKSDQAIDVNVARYSQYYKGIRVEHGNYIVASKNGVMSYMMGDYYKVPTTTPTVAQLTERNAFARALAFTNAKEYMWEQPGADDVLKEELNDPNATYTPHGQLAYVEDFYAGNGPDGHLHLAWKFDIYATEPLSRNEVFIDAATGNVLYVNSIIKHIDATGVTAYSGPVSFKAKTNATNYTLHDTTRGSGINTYSLNGQTNNYTANRVEITSPTTTFDTNIALDAHWGSEMVYDYWKNKHNRLSYNGSNAALNSYVHYGSAYNNAFWNGSSMSYGDGSGLASGGFLPMVSLDITGHEIGHGVCAATANLASGREPGAMNEGLSDIWGACIEAYADPHEVDAVPKSTWEMGEEVGSTALRSASNPKAHQNPDTYAGLYWQDASTTCGPNGMNDQCGVHNNSTVLSHWFYLMTVGGNGNNDLGNYYAINPLGMDTAGMVVWGAETSITSSATYATMRNASINYASTQFGACSKVVEAVTRAWYAVGVGTNYTPCTAQISFNNAVTNISEGIGSNDCAASYVAQIPVTLNGPAPTGGNAVATITVTGGTAVSGVDYLLSTNTVTFPAGSTATQYIPVTIYDNGNILDTGRYFDISLTVAANGSSAAAGNVLTATRVKIVNNDAAPIAGGTEIHTVGTTQTTSTVTSPFPSARTQAHMQYILTVGELNAANLRPNIPITKLGFIVSIKKSTQAFTDYTVKMGTTTNMAFTGTFLAGLTQVYNGNYSTNLLYSNITFNNSYTWDGVSNLVIDICYTNASADTASDLVSVITGAAGRVAYAGNNNTTGGCSLAYTNVSDARPVIRFSQEVPPTKVATATGNSRIFVEDGNKTAYFYNDADTGIIAGIMTGTTGLGCVTATVTGEGNGFQPATFSNGNRSKKEITISASGSEAVENDVIMYLNSDEIAGTNLSSIYLVKTTAATDAAIHQNNTVWVAVPSTIDVANIKGFPGHFTGLGRYFLLDKVPTLGVSAVNGGNSIYVNNNPFRNDIMLTTNLQKSDNAAIRLYDVTGKIVYSETRMLNNGTNIVTIPVGKQQLVPGHYVLQVVCSDQVYTQKVVKE